jgi:signal transduction histidine kinase
MTFSEVLSFSKKKEEAFQQFLFKQDLIICRATAYLVISILALLITLDYFRVMDFTWVLLARMIVITVLAILLFITYQKWMTSGLLQLWLLVINLIFLVSLFFMDAMTKMPQFYLTNSIVVFIFIAATVSGLRFRYSSVLTIILVIFSIIYFQFSIHSEFHKTQIPNIIVSLNVGLLIGFIWERHKRINYLQQTQLNSLINIFSHDMVSPLNSLLSLLSLNDRKMLEKSEFDEHIENIKKTTTSNVLLLQNLVKWSKSQMNGFAPNAISVSARQLVVEAVNLLENMASEKNITIRNMTEESHQCYVDFEMGKLILRNTLSNAIKFSHLKGVIEIYSKNENGMVELFVKDDGVGIDREIIDRLFTMKVQSTPGTADERGTGIGLYVTREFVTLNKGEIKIESKQGAGSTVRICLPEFRNR